MWKKIVGSIALILIVLGIGGVIAWLKYRSVMAAINMPPPAETATTVKMEHPIVRSFQSQSTAIGTVIASRSLTLQMEMDGTIIELNLRPGQKVKAGDKLIELDSSIEAAQLLAAKANRDSTLSNYRRNKEAAQQRAVSELELDQSEAQLAIAEAQVKELEARIAKKVIYAPFDAIAGVFDFQPGQYISQGQTITALVGTDPYLFVDFMMPADVADELFVGDQVVVMMHKSTIDATVVAVDSAADRATRNLRARCRVDNPPKAMQPNDSARVVMSYGPKMDLTVFPATAVRRSPNGSYVFTVVQDENQQRARDTPIEIVRSLGDSVAVASGITTNDLVITDGSFKLREGMLVHELSEVTPAAEASLRK